MQFELSNRSIFELTLTECNECGEKHIPYLDTTTKATLNCALISVNSDTEGDKNVVANSPGSPHKRPAGFVHANSAAAMRLVA